MIDIKDVPAWTTSSGIGHIVMKGISPSFTACGSLIWGGEIEKEVPKKICKKCRAMLDKITPIEH